MDVIELERKALGLMRESRWKEAVPLLKLLLDQNPQSEHGAPWYDIACCHDELDEIEEARRCYLRALDYDETNSIYWGGLASFLYRHGTPEEALDAFNRYLHEVGESSEPGKKARVAIHKLKTKIGDATIP